MPKDKDFLFFFWWYWKYWKDSIIMTIRSLSKILIILTFLLAFIGEGVTHAVKVLLIDCLKFVKAFPEAWLFEGTEIGFIAGLNAFIVADTHWADEGHLHAGFKSIASSHHLWPLLILIIIVWLGKEDVIKKLRSLSSGVRLWLYDLCDMRSFMRLKHHRLIITLMKKCLVSLFMLLCCFSYFHLVIQQ